MLIVFERLQIRAQFRRGVGAREPDAAKFLQLRILAAILPSSKCSAD